MMFSSTINTDRINAFSLYQPTMTGLRVLFMVIMFTKLHGLRRAAGSIQVTQGQH